MRHGAKGKKFGRVANQRKALLRSLCESLILHGKVKTSLLKAKAIKPETEKLITRAKRNSLSDLRYFSSIFPKNVVEKLTKEITPKYNDRNGGYLRILSLGQRKSDGSKEAIIEFV